LTWTSTQELEIGIDTSVTSLISNVSGEFLSVTSSDILYMVGVDDVEDGVDEAGAGGELTSTILCP